MDRRDRHARGKARATHWLDRRPLLHCDAVVKLSGDAPGDYYIT
jgi:hypothetical protein